MGRHECSFCGGNVRVCGHGRERRAVFHTRHLGAVRAEAVAARKMMKSESFQGKMPNGPSSLSKMASAGVESPRRATNGVITRGVKRSSDGLGSGEAVGKRVKIQSDVFRGSI
ncbi:uncharacterized protein CCOS01_04237 [Colletotrichum costaricense]|uniref:Uncharacterized protein n=1 Tax=Colletotrichum costaricense TaxID=1209916 RepID=A0AAI9Z3F5_9PEZI|nr:uncharacterized protein CCOS01_04237 [Colletotrichum costaricense]KAK1532254.1 hypothetical protein CCOS01_04237 [Colletotrichum costaricense]